MMTKMKGVERVEVRRSLPRPRTADWGWQDFVLAYLMANEFGKRVNYHIQTSAIRNVLTSWCETRRGFYKEYISPLETFKMKAQ